MSERISSSIEPDLDEATRHISELLHAKPLAALDLAIEALGKSSNQEASKLQVKLLNQFARACLSFNGMNSASEAQHPIDELFSPANPSAARQEIAVALARLLIVFPDLQTRPDMSQRIMKLFDECFSETLYRLAKVDRTEQSFVKIREICSFITNVENEFGETIARISTIQDAVGFRPVYLKKIRSGQARCLIHPFLPNIIREERIGHLLGQVEEYGASSGAAILDAYNQVQRSARDLMEAAESVGTRYSKTIINGIATRLIAIVTEDFLRTPFSKQADIRIDLGDKKYPLGLEGACFSLELTVNNAGPGYAFDVAVRLKDHIQDDGEFDFSNSHVELGGIEPGSVLVEFPCKVTRGGYGLCVEFECTWKNFDQSIHQTSEMLEIRPQRTGIDWTGAQTADPYSLSPVATVNDLVGRAEILNRLLALTKGQTVESAFIRGQKRVGKTSIAKALQSRLLELFPKDYVIVYLEAGDYIAHDGKQTVELLGRAICREVRLAHPQLSRLQDPDFSGGLAPLNSFLQDAVSVASGCRILFILDEFDELPLELYRRGMIGDAFFRTIRSISNKQQFGFVLVGGEKMEFVLSCQGDALNKFDRFSVDYFEKQTSWADFQDLIKRPAGAYLDFSDSAVNEVYELSAGNPYFAKLICKTIFASMIRRRDCYVSRREVESAVAVTLTQIGANSFAHFWQDGISEPPPRSEEISVMRRKVLLSWADCVRNSTRDTAGASIEQIMKAAQSMQLGEIQVKHEVRDFERRQVLRSAGDGRYTAKVALFGRWLIEKGYQEIVTTMLDRDALLQLKQQEELNRIKEEEIAQLNSRWDLFLGQRVTSDAVRLWLNQFKGIDNQRIAFRILQGLQFYSGDLIRQKMREIHGIVTRQIVWQRKARQPRRRDLIVSAIGGLGHSGAEYARRYADENQIHPDSVLEMDQIPEAIGKADSEVKAIIFVDDFIGTGHTLCSALSDFPPAVKEALKREGLLVLLLVIAGYTKGVSAVHRTIEQTALGIELHVCDSLPSEESLFGERSKVFPVPEERLRAKDIVHEYGVQLDPDAPFGYGHTEAAVVFENKIPNNCPPILWKQKGAWKPLFRRT